MKNHTKTNSLLIHVLVLLLVAIAIRHVSPALAREPLDPVAVEAFADAHFLPAMKASGIPGVALAIVQDGETVLLKGYGTADVETGAPVDPERALFRLGSITKPLTAIAVLRLVERGVLELDVDVNQYLKAVRVPDAFGEPVTLAHLLTHTAGFDADMSFMNFAPGADSSMTPAAIERRLQRVRAPGRVASYDVVGFGLAGLVLRDVTGQSYASVIREHVFEPLGMAHSVVGTPSARVDEMARCHISTRPGDARLCAHPTLAEMIEGSGAAAAPAADMARLMKALLAGGTGVLTPARFADLTDFDRYRFHPFGQGIGLSIRELDNAKRRAIGHGGGINGFNNDMNLFPEDGIGIYFGVLGGAEQIYDARLSTLPSLLPDSTIPSTALEAAAALRRFTDAFAERFLPQRPAWPRRTMTTAERASLEPMDDTASLAGIYLHSRFVSNSMMVNLARHSLLTTVERVDDDALRIDGAGPYLRIAPLFYEDPEAGRSVAFRVTDIGTFLAFRGDPYSTYEKRPWYAHPRFSILPLPLALVLLLSAAIYLLPRFPSRLRRAAALLLAGGALFFIALVLELEYATMVVEIRNAPYWFWLWRLGLHAGLLLVMAAPVLGMQAVHELRGTVSKRVVRIHLAGLSLFGIYLLGIGIYWDLVIS